MEINYFDRDGEIKVTLFSEEAERIVDQILADGKPPKENQIRKFYDDVLNFKSRIEGGESFREILPYLRMLKAKTHIAKERKVINSTFKNFIDSNIEYVTDLSLPIEEMEKRFKIFCTFFEAVVAFYKGRENKGNTPSHHSRPRPSHSQNYRSRQYQHRYR
ncbi:MAG: type III-A CRISPR-associated protein Csm2 [Campylobacterales bacterium]